MYVLAYTRRCPAGAPFGNENMTYNLFRAGEHGPRREHVAGGFATIEAAILAIPRGVIMWERDPDGHDAADAFGADGNVYSVEAR
jgi:hypothetical protein